MDESKHLRVPSGNLVSPSASASSPSPSPTPSPQNPYAVRAGDLDDSPYSPSHRRGGASPAASAAAGKPGEDGGLIASLEAKTGIPALYLSIGLVILGWVLVVAIFGTHTFVHFVAFAYPAYMSYKTLELRGGDSIKLAPQPHAIAASAAPAGAAASPSPSPAPPAAASPSPSPVPVSPNAPAGGAASAPVAVMPAQYEDLTPLMHWLTYWVVYALFIVSEFVVDPLMAWLPWWTVIKLAFLFWCFLPQTTGCVHVYNLCIRPFLHANESRIDTALDRMHFAAVQARAEMLDVTTELATAALHAVTTSIFVGGKNGSGNQNALAAAAARAALGAVAGNAAAGGGGGDDDSRDNTPLSSPHRKAD